MTKHTTHSAPLTRVARRSPRRLLKSATVLLLLLRALLPAVSVCGSAVRAEAAANSEYQVKAAFLYNFMKFVDWPGDGLSTPGTVTLGILGKDPFGEALDEVRGKTVKGRRVVVVHLRGIDELKECDLLYICASERGRLSQILKAVQNARVLTVADQDGFCQAGGMINLLFVKNRVGFEVNVAAASRARFRVSSQLLKLARLVLEN
jgi:hypothetical protein